jgi:hypothetical protein
VTESVGPVTVEEQLYGSSFIGRVPPANGICANARCSLRLLQSILRTLVHSASISLPVSAFQQPTRYLKSTMPLAMPECTPSVSTPTRVGADETPRRSRTPELIVVAALGIETHHQRRLPIRSASASM